MRLALFRYLCDTAWTWRCDIERLELTSRSRSRLSEDVMLSDTGTPLHVVMDADCAADDGVAVRVDTIVNPVTKGVVSLFDSADDCDRIVLKRWPHD